MRKFNGLLLYRDDFYSQKGVIKSAAVSFEGKVAPFALHLYLEEMAIFQEVPHFLIAISESAKLDFTILYSISCCNLTQLNRFICGKNQIVDFGNALLEGFGSSAVSNEEQPDVNESTSVEFLRKTSTGQRTTNANVTANVPPKILFVLSLGLQLEAFQVVLGDRRIGDGKSTSRHSSFSNGQQSRNQGGGHGGEKSLFPGQGRYSYFATLPISLDTFLGDGHETKISFQLDGAHVGVVKKLHKAEQQQALYQSLVDGTVLDVNKLFQIVESGFAWDRSKITVSGPRLIGQMERQSTMHQGGADAETHLVSFSRFWFEPN